MKRILSSFLLIPCALLVLAGCGASNRLADYDFRGRTVAVVSDIPPYPEVVTGDFVDADNQSLLATIVHAGSIVAREAQAHKARKRLGEAVRHVDVSQRIADRVLVRGAQYLRARPVDDDREADFLIDIRVRRYGIEAESWNAGAFFELDADVVLIDPRGRVVWKSRVRERDPITTTLFAGATVTNIVTADALSRLSAEEMREALERLADFAADRMTHELRRDLGKARD